MLSQLTVKNFAIAEHVEVLFHKGMSVLSGETGAGKSIILDALGLTLGDRADTSMVRHKCEKAEVSAVFELHDQAKAAEWLKANDLDDDMQCILRRVITAEGRSRAYINGHPCPLQHLKTIGELLIDIHSQHEHQSLLDKENHRHIIDTYGQLSEQAHAVARCFDAWKRKERTLLKLENNQDESAARLQLLEFQIDELGKLNLSEGEVEALETEQSELANAGLFLGKAHEALDIASANDTNLLSMLNSASGTLENLPSENTLLKEAQNLFGEARIQIEEAANSLRAFVENFEVDPERLNWVEDRLSETYQLARKHRCEPETLADVHARLEEERLSLSTEQNLEALSAEVEQLKEAYLSTAQALREARTKRARALERDVAKQLALLEMKGVTFHVDITPLAEQQVSQHGLDKLEFLISTNVGQPAKPLRKVASGGELSRISLAIQVVIAQHSAIPTLVFDEVDVGIGGGTAQIVGRLLRSLGDRGQVICVTHQAQVASQGHHHFFISKRQQKNTVRSFVDLLNTEDRTKEIARMLGGLEMTEQTVAHAKEMLGELSTA